MGKKVVYTGKRWRKKTGIPMVLSLDKQIDIVIKMSVWSGGCALKVLYTRKVLPNLKTHES
jgi:hypothetical protein